MPKVRWTQNQSFQLPALSLGIMFLWAEPDKSGATEWLWATLRLLEGQKKTLFSKCFSYSLSLFIFRVFEPNFDPLNVAKNQWNVGCLSGSVEKNNDVTMTAWCSIAPPTASTIRVEVVDQNPRVHQVFSCICCMAGNANRKYANLTKHQPDPLWDWTQPKAGARNASPRLDQQHRLQSQKPLVSSMARIKVQLKETGKGWVGVARGQQVSGAVATTGLSHISAACSFNFKCSSEQCGLGRR